MTVRILEVKQNSPEWHAIRKEHVTGSNADILLTRGLDEALKANLSTFNGNFYTARGHILEDEAIELYEAINGATVERPGFVVNDKYPGVGCSPDGFDGDILLEVKCFGSAKHLSIFNIRTVPFKVMAQIQFNMLISGRKLARLILYNPDIEDPKQAYREIEIRASLKIFSNITRKLKGA